MTREEALIVLVKMRAWRRWGKGEQNEKDMPEMPVQKEVDEAFDVCIEMLSRTSLSSDLDEAAEKDAIRAYAMPEDGNIDDVFKVQEARIFHEIAFKAGAEWMAGQGFISEGIINQISGEDTIIELNEHIGYLEDCEEVIVNIRKKQ